MAVVPSIGRAARVEGSVPREAERTRDLYERYAGQIFSYCLHQLGSREEAEDAVQSTFLNAFRGLQRGVVPELESAWLFKIAQNVCLSRRRSSWRRGRIESPADFDLVEELAPAPSRRGDELIGLQDVLEQMPEGQRRAILLREWQGLSYREIAAELELSQAAVETLIFRARQALAAGLERAPERRRGRIRRSSDLGNLVAGLKSFLLGGGAAAKVAATVAVVSATTVVAAAPVEQHRQHSTPPPAAPARPAAHVPAPAAPAAGVASVRVRAAQSDPPRDLGAAPAEAPRASFGETPPTSTPTGPELQAPAVGALAPAAAPSSAAPPAATPPETSAVAAEGRHQSGDQAASGHASADRGGGSSAQPEHGSSAGNDPAAGHGSSAGNGSGTAHGASADHGAQSDHAQSDHAQSDHAQSDPTTRPDHGGAGRQGGGDGGTGHATPGGPAPETTPSLPVLPAPLAPGAAATSAAGDQQQATSPATPAAPTTTAPTTDAVTTPAGDVSGKSHAGGDGRHAGGNG